MQLIQVEQAALGYDGKVVVEHLNFTVEKGDYICVIGENGVGKSTLVKNILGLCEPISGTIQKNDVLAQGQIGYLPQRTQVQHDFPASVREVVRSGCATKGFFGCFYTKEQKQRVKENLEKMGISHLEKACFSDLSGGQQQRVLLARALCTADTLLVLDEPVTGLDPDATKELYQTIDELNAQGITIFMISHDVEQSLRHAKKVLYLGKEHFFGSVQEYLQRKKDLEEENNA